jgi:hypothetical protein
MIVSAMQVGRRKAFKLALVVSLFFATECDREEDIRGAGIQPRIEVIPPEIPPGAPVAVTYNWNVDPGSTVPSEPYGAFIHFVDGDGALLFVDDHVPQPPPTAWRAGQRYSYSRLVLTRIVPYVGDIEVRVGLYPLSGRGERWALKGRHRGLREYAVGRLTLFRRDRKREPVYREGFGPVSSWSNAPFDHSRTMSRKARIKFKNPGAVTIVFIDALAETNAAPRASQLKLQLRSGWRAFLPFVGGAIRAAVRLPHESLGQNAWVSMHLLAGQASVPGKSRINDSNSELLVHVRGIFIMREDECSAALSPWIITASRQNQ